MRILVTLSLSSVGACFNPMRAGHGTAGAPLATLNALMTIGLIVGAPFLALSDVRLLFGYTSR